MILLLENFVDASVTKAEMSEMKVSIGVVGVRLFVPVWITINSGCSWSAFCKTSLAWSTLGHLKYLCSCCGLNSFLLLRNFPFESQRKTAVFDLTVIGGNCPGGSLFPEWPFCKGACPLGTMLSSVGGFGKGFSSMGSEASKIAWGSLVVVSVLSGVSNGFSHNARTCSLRKLTSVKSPSCCSFKAKLDSTVLVCFFWRDWFSSCSFLIWVDCCDNMSWSNLTCNERSVEMSSIACFWSFRRLSCRTILSFICWRSPELIIWNWVKSASNWPSVSLSDEIVLRRLGVIVKGSAVGVDKAVFVVIGTTFCARPSVVLEEGISSSATKWIELAKKLWSDDAKIDLSWTEEIPEKFSILLSLFTLSRSTGNSCVLQSSIFFPWTWILPVVVNTVITTNISSEVEVSSTRWMTSLSHFEGEL